MLKNLSDAHRHDAFGPMFHQLDDMLIKSEWVFSQTSPENVRTADVSSLYEDIYDHDRQINSLERSIRNDVLRYLAAHGAGEASTCLMLMVVIKDAERIGDYCKNIFEVLLYCGPSRYASVHVGEFQLIRGQVRTMLPLTRQACSRGDLAAAQQVIHAAGGVSRQTDFMVQQILEATDSEVPEPAAQVLLARHYKRISSHLSNICTAVTSPVDMLGYHHLPEGPAEGGSAGSAGP